jgi:hypothetical protein
MIISECYIISLQKYEFYIKRQKKMPKKFDSLTFSAFLMNDHNCILSVTAAPVSFYVPDA